MSSSSLKVFFKPQHRQIVLSTLILLFVIFSLVVYQIHHTFEEEVESAQQNATNTANVLERMLGSTFEKVDLVMIDIVRENNLAYTKMNLKHVRELLDRKKNLVPEIFSLRLAAENGQIIVDTDTTDEMGVSNIALRKYFQYQKSNQNGGVYVSEPLEGRSRALYFAISRRIESRGEFKGLLIAIVKFSDIKAVFASYNLGRAGNVTLASVREKILLYRLPEKPELFGKIIPFPDQVEEAMSLGKAGAVFRATSKLDSRYKTYGVRFNYKYNFLITHGIAAIDYLRDWVVTIFFTAFLVLVVIVGYCVGFARYLNSLDEVEIKNQRIAEVGKLAILAEMASGVAHEINNPVAIIKARAEDITEYLIGHRAEASMITAAHSINLNVDRVARIVGGMRSLISPLSGSEDSYCHIHDAVRMLQRLYDQKLKEEKIEFRVGEVPEVFVRFRATHLLQTLSRLLTNSIEALAKLNESEKWIEISFQSGAEDLKILFTDSGSGISRDMGDKIMNPFFTTKLAGEGAGLGLSISKNIVLSYGGNIFLNESNPHTQFVIILKTVSNKVNQTENKKSPQKNSAA